MPEHLTGKCKTCPETTTGGPAVEITLLRGQLAIVSPEDAKRVLALTWRLGSNGYVYCCKRSGQEYALLHRFVVEASPDVEIHHDNGIATDCRRGNLTAETPSDHQRKHHSHLLIARNMAGGKFP